MKRFLSLVVTFALSTKTAFAYPEGAPWGAANPGGAQSCATCHFDFDVEKDSGLIALAGLPEVAASDETYELTLTLEPGVAVVAGFMLSASGGVFHHAKRGIETNEQDVRSTAPVPAEAGASWKVTWTAPSIAPEDNGGEIFFYAAVNGANDDMSSFGDKVYFKTYAVRFGE